MQKLHLSHRHTLGSVGSFSIYLAVLFLSFHYFFIVYINSNFLSTFINEKFVGYFYIGGSILGIMFLLISYRILRKIGNYRFALIATIVEILTLVVLSQAQNIWVAGIAFMIQHATNPIILYSLDIFLESVTSKEDAGKSRGLFLTILNTPPIVATLVTGIILRENDFSQVYMIAIAFLIPLLMIIMSNFKKFRDEKYIKIEVKDVLNRFKSERLIRDIFIDNVLLQVFYAVMTIYLPVYLLNNIGFSLAEISFIFSVMLVPFVLLQFPVGRIADEKLGEKELLILGFVIMTFSMLMISFIKLPTLILWAMVLILTRIGAAIVEIMTETYFFKHVGKRDAHVMSIFRMSHGIAFALMPLIGGLLLLFVSIQYIFVIFAFIILFFGLRYAFDLVDTK